MNKNTENRQKMKTRDIFTVVLLALINVVLFFCKRPAVCHADYNYIDAGIFFTD